MKVFLKSIDEDLAARLQHPTEGRIPSSLAALISFTGKSPFFMAVLVLLAIFGSSTVRHIVFLIAIADGLTYVTVHALKRLIKRARPAGEFSPRSRRDDPYSFPSGHAARGGSFAVMALLLGPIAFSLAGLVWGLLVGLSRVRVKMHYPLDVLAGWLLGGGLAAAVYALLK